MPDILEDFKKTFDRDRRKYAWPKIATGYQSSKPELKPPQHAFGVVKWFNRQKEPNGYIVTTFIISEGVKKVDSGFIEIPFSSAVFAKGFTPKPGSLVVFTVERTNGRLCISSLRNAQFTSEDFRLALKYATHGIFKVSGVSRITSDWTCDVHILRTLSKEGALIDDKADEVKGWVSSYLHGQSEIKQNSTIEVWRSNEVFSSLVNRFIKLPLRTESPVPHDSQVPNSKPDKAECEVKNMLQNHLCADVDNDIVMAAQSSLNNAAQEQLNRMYASKLGNRLNELDSPTDYDRRRWVWELIQNAKDSIVNSNDKNSVRIHLEINDDTLRFEHNGSPFISNTVYALQYQYSQDKRNQEESTGRFGTGFMTTHCLSRIVSVEGDLACDQGVCGFSFDLHREGNDYEEIIDCLNQTEKSKQFFPKPFGKTSFTYHIGSESAKRAVSLGIDEVRRYICAVMCFCPEIESVSVVNNGALYSVNMESRNELAEGVSQITFFIHDNGEDVRRTFLMASIREDCELLSQKYNRPRKARIDAAIEIDGTDNAIMEVEKASSVFCVFPVIGTEQQLQEPFLLNSPDFELTTERDALFLSGGDTNENGRPSNVAVNKKIFEKAPVLFRMIVNCLIQKQANKFYLLADGLRGIKEHKHLDHEWYKAHVQNEYRRILREAKVVDPAQGCEKLSLSDCFIVDEISEERTAEVFDLMSDFITGGEIKSPIRNNDEWVKRLWREDNIQVWDIKSLCKFVSSRENWDALPFREGIVQIDWFNRFVAMVQKYEETMLRQMPLIPDMLGGFHATKDTDFEQGEGMDNFVMTLMNRLGSDVRTRLMHLGIKGISLERKFNSLRFSSEINKLIKARIESFKNYKPPLTWSNVIEALRPLLEVTPIGDKCSKGFKEKREATAKVLKSFCKEGIPSIESGAFHESAWNEIDNWLSTAIPKYIQDYYPVKMQEDAEAAIAVLNCFYHWFETTGRRFGDWKVFPNQHGKFVAMRDLSYEAEPIDEQLKDMVARLDEKRDFRTKLIDVRCKTTNEKPSHAVTQKEVCDELDRLVNSGKDSFKDGETYRAVVRELLDEWAENHKDLFMLYFPRAYQNYNELELNVVHTKDERRLANGLLKLFGRQELEEMLSGKTPERFRQPSGEGNATMDFSDNRMGGLSKNEMEEAQNEAKLKAKEALEAEGFVLAKGLCEDDFTLINGVMKNGVEYPVVVRSYKEESRQFQLSTTDWDQLVKPNSKLLVLKRDGQIYSIKFRELIARREKIDLSFSTANLEIGERVGELATVLRWFKGLKFDFDQLTATRAGVAESFDLPEQGIPEGQREYELSSDDPKDVLP